jgi:hypothetical protein
MSFSQLQGNVLFSLQKLLLTRIYDRYYFEHKNINRYKKTFAKELCCKGAHHKLMDSLLIFRNWYSAAAYLTTCDAT